MLPVLRLLRLAVCMALLTGAVSHGQFLPPQVIGTIAENPGLILAEQIHGSVEQERLTFLGRVQFRFETINFSADHGFIDPRTAQFEGRVTYADQDVATQSERMILDRQTETLLSVNGMATDQELYMTYASARQSSAGHIQLESLTLAPCPDCSPIAQRPWAIHAADIELDPNTHQAYLNNLQLQILGVPLLSSPRWQFADPRLQRLSGYLQPTIRNTPAGSQALNVSYFQALSDQRDLRYSWEVHQDGTPLMEARFRHATATEFVNLRGQVADHDGPLGDISLSGDWFLGPHSRVLANARWQSNENFGDTYGHDGSEFRRANVRWETFGLYRYGRLELSRDLRGAEASANFPGEEIPTRLTAQYKIHELPWHKNSRLTTSFGLDAADREAGRDTANLAAEGRLDLPASQWRGQTWQSAAFATAGLARADGISTTSDEVNPEQPNYWGDSPYATAGLSLDGKFPLHGTLAGEATQLLPRLRLTYVNGDPPEGEVANEDALAPFLSATTLFRPANSGYLDRAYVGTRVDMGIDANTLVGPWDTRLFLGQRWQDKAAYYAPAYSGLSEGLSALVLDARIEHPHHGISLAYLGHVGVDLGQETAHIVEAGWPVDHWRQSVGLYDIEEGDELEGGQKWTTSLRGKLSTDWSGSVSFSDEFDIPGSAALALRATYRDCCFALRLYADFDENNGDMEASLGFAISVLDIVESGRLDVVNY